MNAYLNELFKNQQKMCDTNLSTKIDNIEYSDDIFKVTFQMDNFTYKDIAIIKGKIFPNPKKNNNINIEKIYYKYDDDFNLRLYVDAKIINDKITNDFNNNEIKNISKTLDFSEENITETLKSYFKIAHNLITNLFIVDSVNAKDYSIKCIENNKIFTLPKNNEKFDKILNTKDILLINDYISEQEQEQININLSLISIVEKLTDENLFYILENDKRIKNSIYLWGKVLEVSKDNKNAIIMNNNKEILKFINNNNIDIKIGQFFLFSNYIIDKENNITLNKGSFYYFSSQEVYFSDRIQLNLYSVIQFYFLDFKDKDNIFNVIKIGENSKEIQNNKMNFIVQKKKIKNFEIYVEEIKLLKNELDIFSHYSFYVSIMQGFINQINTFINYQSNYAYYYEYLYYSYITPNFLDYKEININNKNIKISIYDDFGSKNRRKFNILNIPFQNECNNKELINIKSKLVCEMFFENSQKSALYGIFNLMDLLYIFIDTIKLSNDIFDKYYDIFGNIYDYLKQERDDNKLVDFVNNYNIIYKKYSKELESLNFKKTYIYGEKISLSQLKARIGIILSSYMEYIINPDSIDDMYEDILNNFQIFIRKIGKHEDKLTKEQILRLIIIYMDRKFKGTNPKLIFLSEHNEKTSPFVMAKKFNISEIENLDEFSGLFSGYIQMDSYILYNYYDEVKASSYSFSLEPFFITKYNLISNYEDFILIENIENDVLAITDIDTRITCINEEKLLKRSNEVKISTIKDSNSLRNHSFGVSIIFRHEKNSHQKKNLKSDKISSPQFYCNFGKIKKINYLEGNRFVGEDGILIESLITENRKIILSLAKDFIYGELFDIKYFIANDFSELLQKIKNIQEKSKDYFAKFGDKFNKEDKMEDLLVEDEVGERLLKEKIFGLFKTGQILIADQLYCLDLITDIINLAKKNEHYDDLPSIFKMIDEELKKMKIN